jgi:hypothetical protein
MAGENPVKIVGKNGTETAVTGQNELLVRINSSAPGQSSDASEATLQAILLELINIEQFVDEIEIGLQDLWSQSQGTINTLFSLESLPYTITSDTYNSFSITTIGSVSIDGVTVPEGTVISASHPSASGYVNSPTFSDVSGGSLFVVLGIKLP